MTPTLSLNQDKNSEMKRTTVATPAMRSASDQRAAENLYAGMLVPVDPVDPLDADAAPAGAPTPEEDEACPAAECSDAPHLEQNAASSAASL
jgi:hypothetical protein